MKNIKLILISIITLLAILFASEISSQAASKADTAENTDEIVEAAIQKAQTLLPSETKPKTFRSTRSDAAAAEEGEVQANAAAIPAVTASVDANTQELLNRLAEQKRQEELENEKLALIQEENKPVAKAALPSEKAGNILDKAKGEESTPWLKSLFGFFVAISAFLLMAFVYSKLSLKKNIFRTQVPMKVLHSLSLGAKKQVLLVDIQGERILLGVSPQGVNFLCKKDELGKKEIVAEKKAAPEVQAPVVTQQVVPQQKEVAPQKASDSRGDLINQIKNISKSLRPFGDQSKAAAAAFYSAKKPAASPANAWLETLKQQEEEAATFNYSSDGGFSHDEAREEREFTPAQYLGSRI